jgi:cell wall assembly regulator SMI1
VFGMASPAAPLPPAGGVGDGVEPAPEWVGDVEAAARFSSPEAIRGGLLPEHVGEFDAAFDAALTAARQTLRLDQLRSVLQVWRRVALLTEQDPDGYRAMLAAAAEVRGSGQPRPGSVSWAELRAELEG